MTSGPRKPHNISGRAGCISLRRVHETGTTVGVYACEESGIDGGDGNPYVTVCELHGSVVGHENRADALYQGASPRSWCEACQKIGETKPEPNTIPEILHAIRRSLRRLDNLDRDLAVVRLGYPAGTATAEIAAAGVMQTRRGLEQLEEELEVDDGIYLADTAAEGDLGQRRNDDPAGEGDL